MGAPCGVNQAARTFDLAPGPAVFCARLTCTCEAVVVAVPRVAGSYSRVADAFAHSCRKHRTQCTGHSSSIARHVSALMSERWQRGRACWPFYCLSAVKPALFPREAVMNFVYANRSK